MIRPGPDHVEPKQFPDSCACAFCRVVSVVHEACCDAIRAMPAPAERQRVIDALLAGHQKWVYLPDGGVLVLLHGRPLARVGPTTIKLAQGSTDAGDTAPALRPVS